MHVSTKSSRAALPKTRGTYIAVLVGALWCSGSCSRLVFRELWVRIPLGAYALRQGILSTLVSLDSGVVDGYPVGICSL